MQVSELFSNYTPVASFDDEDADTPWHRRLQPGQMLMASDVERALEHVAYSRNECVFKCEWVCLFLNVFYHLCHEYQLADSYEEQWESESSKIVWPSDEERDTMLRQVTRATEIFTMPVTRETRFILFPFLPMPTNGGRAGSHYVLLLLDRMERTLDVYDSAARAGLREGVWAAQRIAWLWKWLQPANFRQLLTIRLAINHADEPHQRDGWACGHFVVAYAAARVRLAQPLSVRIDYPIIAALLSALREAYGKTFKMPIQPTSSLDLK